MIFKIAFLLVAVCFTCQDARNFDNFLDFWDDYRFLENIKKETENDQPICVLDNSEIKALQDLTGTNKKYKVSANTPEYVSKPKAKCTPYTPPTTTPNTYLKVQSPNHTIECHDIKHVFIEFLADKNRFQAANKGKTIVVGCKAVVTLIKYRS